MYKIIVTFVLFFVCLGISSGQPAKTSDKKTSARIDDVPVVKPLPKKSETNPNKTTDDQGVLPINLIKNKADSMAVGTSSYVSPFALKVDSKRKCWLHPYTLYGEKNTERTLQIRRDPSGYHVVVEGTDHTWIAEDFDSSSWIPVKSVIVRQ